jgi:serine/threonine protein kinase
MEVVYEARQVSLGRAVALKVLGRALSRPADIARFQREAQAAAKLQHPNIASIYYAGQDDQICFLAMELIDGAALRTAIERLARTTLPHPSIDAAVQQDAQQDRAPPIRFDKPTAAYQHDLDAHQHTGELEISPHAQQCIATKEHTRRCCEIVRDAAIALDHAHGRGVIHRAIKPENLMLDRAGQIRIVDFGVARFFEDATLTHTGQLVGTPMYMSPEQVTGTADLDCRTDIYSLGLVLHELLTLRPAITAPTREGVFRKIVTKSLPPVS